MPELTILYDGACSLCRASVGRLSRFDKRNRIEILDLNDPSVPVRFPNIDREAAMRLMQAVDSKGHVWSGADAWAHIGLQFPIWKWFAWVLLVPGIRWMASQVYAWVARNRYRWNTTICEDGSCAVHIRPGSSSKH